MEVLGSIAVNDKFVSSTTCQKVRFRYVFYRFYNNNRKRKFILDLVNMSTLL